MRFKGKVWKLKSHWLVEVPSLDIMTQGKTKQEALLMVADAIETLVNQPLFKIEVKAGRGSEIEVGSDDAAAV
jgi:hypothetical protein